MSDFIPANVGWRLMHYSRGNVSMKHIVAWKAIGHQLHPVTVLADVSFAEPKMEMMYWGDDFSSYIISPEADEPDRETVEKWHQARLELAASRKDRKRLTDFEAKSLQELSQ